MTTKYTHLVQLATTKPWAILPRYLATIVDLLRYRADGGILSEEQITERLAAAPQRQPVADAPLGIAVLQVRGVLLPRANLLTAMSGGSSVEQLTQAFRQALADPRIGAIVLDVDSPGGLVDGIPELAAEIRAARGTKPIHGNANTMAASAAYWLISQCDEISVTPSGEVGSIGVYAAHDDLSAAYEMEGIKTTLISAGKYKTEGNDLGPLSDDAKVYLQSQIDSYYAMFLKDVAAGRGVPVPAVRGGFGEGRMLMAADAVKEGMADRVATLDQVLAKVSRQVARAAGSQAAASSAFLAHEWDGTPLALDETPDPAPDPDPDLEPVPGAAELELAQVRARQHQRGA